MPPISRGLFVGERQRAKLRNQFEQCLFSPVLGIDIQNEYSRTFTRRQADIGVRPSGPSLFNVRHVGGGIFHTMKGPWMFTRT